MHVQADRATEGLSASDAPVGHPLADLCDGDPLDLEADPRLRLAKPQPPEPCGPLCTPWCLAAH
jgi:hypothetical protein